MGAAAALAQETTDDKRELCAACLDMAAVGAIADEGARASAGTGKAERIKLVHGTIIRFLGNGLFSLTNTVIMVLLAAFIFMDGHGVHKRQEADFGRWAPAFFFRP